jgi:hypothetical protein
MKRLRRLLLPLVLVLPLLAWGAPSSVEEVIAKARSYVGKERDLDGVRSLHYRGRIEVRDAAGVLQEGSSGTIELILQKPAQQKVVRVVGQLRDVVGLDDLTGWHRVEQVADPAKGRTTVVPLAQLRRVQASTFENLAFYRGLERRGGRVELRGESTSGGRPVVRVAFIHPGDIVFLRSFDRETGRLLVTEGQDGERMVEEGELVVHGIRFPQRLVTSGKTEDGSTLAITLIFDEITVNETFPADLFAVPMVRPSGS